MPPILVKLFGELNLAKAGATLYLKFQLSSFALCSGHRLPRQDAQMISAPRPCSFKISPMHVKVHHPFSSALQSPPSAMEPSSASNPADTAIAGPSRPPQIPAQRKKTHTSITNYAKLLEERVTIIKEGDVVMLQLPSEAIKVVTVSGSG